MLDEWQGAMLWVTLLLAVTALIVGSIALSKAVDNKSVLDDSGLGLLRTDAAPEPPTNLPRTGKKGCGCASRGGNDY